MTSFDTIFEAALKRKHSRELGEEHEEAEGETLECAPFATPFLDAVHAFDLELRRAVPDGSKRSLSATTRPDWAETLDVELPCSAEELRRAFRAKAFECHPDRGGSTEAFVKAKAAFDAGMKSDGRDAVRPLPFVTARYESMQRGVANVTSKTTRAA